MAAIVSRRDLDFVLFELLAADRLLEHPRFAAFDRGVVAQMLDTAQEIAEGEFLPIASMVDSDEPRFVDGKALVPPATRQALKAYAAAGFFALPFPEEVGGLQAPWFLHTAVGGLFYSANVGVTNYAFLTIAAANLLNAFGSDELKRIFLPPMLAGEWFGTMCLSEPHAGSSLGDLTTSAAPAGDGTYRITGSKMWISGGEHEIADNIVHMVLARIKGAPAGTRGISLFLVPKRRVDGAGVPGALNGIALGGLNHKLGQRATTNCLLNFGESDACLGYLIGEPNHGLEYMFHMMNEARIGVGHSSTMAALAGYLYSAEYARTRCQGRRAGERDPLSPQVPIIEHADVRRLLMAQKAAVEGAQALCFYCSTLIDRLATEEDPDERGRLAALLGLLTPVVKSWPSEHCLEANKWAIQILGGYGYTRDYPVERLYRDNRLNHIHEGTFGIQGMDLLGRKVSGDDGEALTRFIGEMRRDAAAASAIPRLAEETARLSALFDKLATFTEKLLACEDKALRLANATVYLDAFGHVVIGWMWLRQADVAARALDGDVSEADRVFYEGKLAANRYFSRHELPLAAARLDLCAMLDDSVLSASEGMFGG